MQGATLQQRTASLSSRPLRFGFIINRAVQPELFAEIVQYNTCLWGGFYNLFVPTDGERIREDWWNILLYHDPDILFFVGETSSELAKKVYAAILPLQSFQWDVNSLKQLTTESNQVNPIYMNRILNEYIAQGKKLGGVRYPVIKSTIFSSYLEVLCGFYPYFTDYVSGMQQHMDVSLLECSPQNLSDYLALLTQIDDLATPLELTRVNLEGMHNIGIMPSNTIILTDGSIDDLCLYHALRWKPGGLFGDDLSVHIIPITTLATEEDIKVFVQWIGTKFKRRPTFASLSVSLEALRQVRESIKQIPELHDWYKHIDIKRCNFTPSIPTKMVHVERQQLVSFNENRMVYETLGLDFSKYVGNQDRWICEIDLSPFADRQGFAPSMFPELNILLSNYSDPYSFRGWGSRARIARGKLAVLVSKKQNIGGVTIPSDRKVIYTALKNFNFEVRSDKKINYEAVLALIGELRDAKFLQNKYILKLFNSRNFIQGQAFTWMEIQQNTAIRKKDFPSDEFEKTKEEIFNWIKVLAGKQIFLRGYNLKCDTCGLETWYPLASVKEYVVCQGCQASFQMPIDRIFAYKLNMLFSDGNNQGMVTVLLTLALLYNLSSTGLIWQAEIPLTDKDGRDLEIDLIAMCDGQLIVAECKNTFLTDSHMSNPDAKREKIEKVLAQLKNNIEFSKKIDADIFLFATLQEAVPAEILEFIEQHNKGPHQLRVLLLSKEELIEGKINLKTEEEHVTIRNITRELPWYDGEDCYDLDKTDNEEIFGLSFNDV